ARNTIMSLLVDRAKLVQNFRTKLCAIYRSSGFNATIWAFCYAKDKNLPPDKKNEFGFGSIWTWTAIDAGSKLICSRMVGNRETGSANEFMQDLASRVRRRIQLTTDGHRPYLEAVEGAFGADIDYAMLVKKCTATRAKTRSVTAL